MYYFVILSLRCGCLIVAAVLYVCWLGVLIVWFVVCSGCLFMYVVAIAAVWWLHCIDFGFGVLVFGLLGVSVF